MNGYSYKQTTITAGKNRVEERRRTVRIQTDATNDEWISTKSTASNENLPFSIKQLKFTRDTGSIDIKESKFERNNDEQ